MALTKALCAISTAHSCLNPLRFIELLGHEMRFLNTHLEYEYQLASLGLEYDGNSPEVLKDLDRSIIQVQRWATRVVCYRFQLELWAYEGRGPALIELAKFDRRYEQDPILRAFHLRQEKLARGWNDKDARQWLTEYAAIQKNIGKASTPSPALLSSVYRLTYDYLKDICDYAKLSVDSVAELRKRNVPAEYHEHLHSGKFESVALDLTQEILPLLQGPWAPNPNISDIKSKKKLPLCNLHPDTKAYIESRQPLPIHPEWQCSAPPLVPRFHPFVDHLGELLILQDHPDGVI